MSIELYRIEDVEKITLNGKQVKTFKAFERKPNALGGYSYVYIGTFNAPSSCRDDKLTGYIDDEE